MLKIILMMLCIYLMEGTKRALSTAHCFEIGAKYDHLYFFIREIGLLKIAPNLSDKGT